MVRKKCRSSVMPGLYPVAVTRRATWLLFWNMKMYGPSSVTVFCRAA